MIKKSILMFVCIFIWGGVEAQPDVFGIELPYRLQQDGKASYNKMWDRMLEMGIDRNLRAMPVKRIYRSFSADNESCVFPATIHIMHYASPALKNVDLISGNPVDAFALRLMVRPGDPVPTKLSDLENKTVALLNGLDPDIYLKDVNTHYEITTGEAVRLKMLYNSRVDVILGFTPDVQIVAGALGFPLPDYEGSFAFYTDQQVSVVCVNTPENRAFIDQFNGVLGKLKDSGELRSIMGPLVNIVD